MGCLCAHQQVPELCLCLPGNFWPVETRSNLRHILDQFRMQQAAEVGLEFWPEGSANAPMDRLGADQGECATSAPFSVLHNRLLVMTAEGSQSSGASQQFARLSLARLQRVRLFDLQPALA